MPVSVYSLTNTHPTNLSVVGTTLVFANSLLCAICGKGVSWVSGVCEWSWCTSNKIRTLTFHAYSPLHGFVGATIDATPLLNGTIW